RGLSSRGSTRPLPSSPRRRSRRLDLTRLLRRLVAPGHLQRRRSLLDRPSEQSPNEAEQLAGDRDDGDLGWLSRSHEVAMARVESVLRLSRELDDVRRLTFAPLPQPTGVLLRQSIAPRGFDDQSSNVAVTAPGDRTWAAGTPGGVETRRHADEAHELARRGETAKVVDLRENRHRREGRDPTQAAKPADVWVPRLCASERLDLRFEYRDSIGVEVELREVLLEGHLGGERLEALRSKPHPVGRAPVSRLSPDPAVAKKELHKSVPLARAVLDEVLSAPNEIPHRLALLGRDVDRGELARSVESCELSGVALIGLHAVAGAARNESGCDHVAVDAHPLELAAHFVA